MVETNALDYGVSYSMVNIFAVLGLLDSYFLFILLLLRRRICPIFAACLLFQVDHTIFGVPQELFLLFGLQTADHSVNVTQSIDQRGDLKLIRIFVTASLKDIGALEEPDVLAAKFHRSKKESHNWIKQEMAQGDLDFVKV